MIRRFLCVALFLCAAPSGAQTPGLPTPQIPLPPFGAGYGAGSGGGFGHDRGFGPGAASGGGALALLATEIPARLTEMMDEAEAGADLGLASACLSRLQAMAVAGGLARAMLPFSDAWTLEDARGPVVRLRMALGGERRHAEAWCEQTRLVARPLDWGAGDAEPRPVSTGTLDLTLAAMTVLGMLPQDLGGGAMGAERGAETGAEAGAAGGTTVIVLGHGETRRIPTAPPPALRMAEATRLREVLARNWSLPRLRDLPDWRRLGVTLRVRLDRSARLVGLPEVLVPRDATGRDWAEAVELATRAVEAGAAEGFDLPARDHDRWADLTVTFDPVRGIRF